MANRSSQPEPGTEVEPQPGTEVKDQAEHLVAQADDAQQSLQELSDQLQALQVMACSTPDGDSSLGDDAGFQRRLRELEVDLLGLQAIELRAEMMSSSAHQRARRSVLRDVLAVRSAELADGLAQLTVGCLGYYALPFPDPLLIDNEGPIGHHWALPAMRALQAYFEPGGQSQGDVRFDRRNRIAGRLFNH